MKNDVFHVRQRPKSRTFAEGKLRSFALRNVRSAARETPHFAFIFGKIGANASKAVKGKPTFSKRAASPIIDLYTSLALFLIRTEDFIYKLNDDQCHHELYGIKTAAPPETIRRQPLLFQYGFERKALKKLQSEL
ncbi:MAG: hypothetical protein IKQ91_00280 [Oscillospiraceae bacterium]|nr:hypothetical protein [Oscillospiraceae bacterium]